jgi:large subunit ribosomal protein L25
MSLKITSQIRNDFGKKVKKLRRNGLVPAAIYGYHGTYNVQVPQKEFAKMFAEASHTAIVEIELEGKKHSCYVEEAQMDYISGEYTHVSFKEVNLNVETTAEIPFELVGAEESPAVKDQDSVIILSKTEITLRGLPKDLPQVITVDVSKMNAGDTIAVSDITFGEGVELVHEEDKVEIVATTASATQAEVEVDVDAAMAEVTADATEGEASAETDEEKK